MTRSAGGVLNATAAVTLSETRQAAIGPEVGKVLALSMFDLGAGDMSRGTEIA
jgi:hypothetical protein